MRIDRKYAVTYSFKFDPGVCSLYVRVNEIPRAGLDVFAGHGKEAIARLLDGMDPYPLVACRLVAAALTLSVDGRTLCGRGSFVAEGEARCDRCAEPIPVRLEKEFSTILLPREASSAGSMEMELSAEDLEVGFYDGVGIEVSDIFWEQVAVALPVKLLCRDDCRGVCPACGANRNAEPCECAEGPSPGPFGVLRELLGKKE